MTVLQVSPFGTNTVPIMRENASGEAVQEENIQHLK